MPLYVRWLGMSYIRQFVNLLICLVICLLITYAVALSLVSIPISIIISCKHSDHYCLLKFNHSCLHINGHLQRPVVYLIIILFTSCLPSNLHEGIYRTSASLLTLTIWMFRRPGLVALQVRTSGGRLATFLILYRS